MNPIETRKIRKSEDGAHIAPMFRHVSGAPGKEDRARLYRRLKRQTHAIRFSDMKLRTPRVR
ncbi:hypothetical protein HMH01_01140 [Halovulum dunhuangense]|uniref:Uncharacterized protein n=1 Tax=Halovulum dunhuangense TaxID=1505036 RepID=A0A849L035_9RHOB|nr:hypothetical protein [Halovulum dunhuangense]NNU79030.1 hypothetical protein [Halovulum dunhuangense]